MIVITGAKGYIGRNLRIPNSIGIDKEVEITRLNRLQRGQIEGIIHLAAISRVKWCQANPVRAVTTNVVGTTSVLELAKRKKAWVIFVSSLDVERKDSIYGLTKSFGEELCKYYSDKYSLQIVVLRLGDVVGKDNHPTKAIPKITKLVQDGKDVILTNPDQMFHLVEIDTVAKSLQYIVKRLIQLNQSKSKIIIKEGKNG